jgi:hypothetical protein
MRAIMVTGVAATVLSACTFAGPVAILGLNGHTLRGTAAGGSFVVTDGRLSCAGSSYENGSRDFLIPIECNDGRKGVIEAHRELGRWNGGAGQVRLNDGSTADFVFGDAGGAFSL